MLKISIALGVSLTLLCLL